MGKRESQLCGDNLDQVVSTLQKALYLYLNDYQLIIWKRNLISKSCKMEIKIAGKIIENNKWKKLLEIKDD